MPIIHNDGENVNVLGVPWFVLVYGLLVFAGLVSFVGSCTGAY